MPCEWAPQVFSWSPDRAGSPDFYSPAFWSHALSGISFHACLPARGLRANPTWEIQLFSEVWSSESGFCCFLLSEVQGWGKGDAGKEPTSWWSGQLVCIWGEKAQDWAELRAEGSLCCVAVDRTFPCSGICHPNLKAAKLLPGCPSASAEERGGRRFLWTREMNDTSKGLLRYAWWQS